MAAQNQDWLKEFEPIEEPVANAGALILPAIGATPKDIAAEERAQAAAARQEAAEQREEIRFAQEQAAGGGARPTEAQQKTLTLLTRIAGGANDIQKTLALEPEAQQAGLLETLSRNVLGEGVVTRGIAGPERRMITDAQADILDALLTLGTGAAYSREQLIGQTISYFPQYGDTQAEIAAKNDRLKRLTEAARIQAGPLAQKFDETIKPLFGPIPPPAETSAGTEGEKVAPIEAGKAFQTEADIAAQRQLQDAWNSGLSVDDLVQFNQQLGRGAFSPADIQRMRDARDQGQPGAITFYATPTGQPTEAQGVIGAALETPVGEAIGGYTMGAANALTAGTLDELAPILGLDPGRVQAAKEYLRQRAPTASLAGEVTGGILGSIPAVRGAGAALAGTRLAATAPLLGEIGYGAAYGAGEAPEDQRALGALIGGSAAGIGGALANRFLPGGPGTFTGVTPVQAQASRFAGPQAEAIDVIAAGQQAGIPVMTSDVRPPETFMGKVTQQLGEIAPFGAAGQRRTQQEAREQAVEDLLSEAGLSANRDVAPDLVRNLTEKRGADLSKFSNMKRDVIERYAGMGDVTPIKSLDAIDRLVSSLEAENLPRQLGPLLQDLRDIKNSLSGPGDLTKIERNRATVFDLKADPSLAKISSKSEKAFGEVYKALNDDIGDFIKTNGDMRDFNRWKVANTKLAMMAGELKQGGLKRVLDKGDFDPATVTRMLTSNNPQEARLLFTNLGKEGRSNARLLLLQNAANKALDPTTQVVNPTVFAREVSKLKDNFGQFFSGAEGRRVKGLVDVLNATRRAQEAQFAPRTGEKVVPFAAAGSLGGLGTLLGFDFGTGVGLATGFGVARRIYESAPVRDLLIRIGNAAGSEKAKLISETMQRISSATAAIGAERAAGPEIKAPSDAIMVGPAQ